MKSRKKIADFQPGRSPLDYQAADKLLQEAIRLHGQGDLDTAGLLYRRVLKIVPRNHAILANLGVLEGTKGNRTEGVTLLRQAIAQAPSHAPYHTNLGNILFEMGAMEEAIQAYGTALTLQPQTPGALNNLGLAHKHLGQFTEAAACFEKAIAMAPEEVEAYNNYGSLYRDVFRFEQAIRMYQKVVELKPEFPEVYINLGNSLDAIGHHEQSKKAYEIALSLRPGWSPAIGGLAGLHEKSGEYTKAYELVKPLIENGAENMSVVNAYANLSKKFGHLDEAITMLESKLTAAETSRTMRQNLHFQLGKLNDTRQSYDTAFAHFRQGNMMQPPAYDKNHHQNLALSYMSFFSPERMLSLPRASNSSEVPIFIVGMPRSGTTLVEQILSAHPAVFGAGEQQTISEIARSLPGAIAGGIDYPMALAHVTAGTLDRLAGFYLEHLREMTDTAGYMRITDKMPYNFWHIGFIHLLFPRARIIHCLRDPVDTCLSCYFQNFVGSHPFAFDFTNLIHYFGLYHSLMRHWRQMPGISMLEVPYDMMVEESETMSRMLVEFCGLDWDDDCLRFYESKRRVRTASYQQVRQPVYRDSQKRWRNYEGHIDELLTGLHEYQQEYYTYLASPGGTR